MNRSWIEMCPLYNNQSANPIQKTQQNIYIKYSWIDLLIILDAACLKRDRFVQQLFIVITLQLMNKDYLIGNKVICQKLHKKQRIRQLNKLKEIKNRPNSFQNIEPSFFRQTSIATENEKIIEIERSNIVLFNRIASIIKQRPKMTFPKSREFVKSLDHALFNQQKKKQELKIKHELYSRRISQQQPTIKNDLIFKERMRHERYLKNIGKYPFNPHKRAHSDFQIVQDRDDQQKNELIFHTKSRDFEVRITKDILKSTYIFSILNLIDNKWHSMSMNIEKFKEELARCQNKYEIMIGKLRMDKKGDIIYAQNQSRQPSPTVSK